jgi:hypothetical protein
MGDRIKAHIERAFPHRGKLRYGLHQGRIGINLHHDRAVGALFEFRAELAAQPVAEIALANGAAGELMRNFQRLSRGERTHARRSNESRRCQHSR